MKEYGGVATSSRRSLRSPVSLDIRTDRFRHDTFSFAVGTAVARRPPHRSERAELPHSAPASGPKAQALLRVGMHDADRREPASGEPDHALPGDVSLLAAPAEPVLPEAHDLMAEGV